VLQIVLEMEPANVMAPVTVNPISRARLTASARRGFVENARMEMERIAVRQGFVIACPVGVVLYVTVIQTANQNVKTVAAVLVPESVYVLPSGKDQMTASARRGFVENARMEMERIAVRQGFVIA
jgi:transcriptional regulator GlxA family with amidase domain